MIMDNGFLTVLIVRDNGYLKEADIVDTGYLRALDVKVLYIKFAGVKVLNT